MISKSKKDKIRGLLMNISPTDKAELLIGGLKDEVAEIGKRVTTSKDYSSQITSLQGDIQDVKNNILDKLNQLPTQASLDDI